MTQPVRALTYIYYGAPRRTILLIVILILCLSALSFAQTSAGEALRTQEMLEQERSLRKSLEEPEKFYFKRIEVQGATCLSAEEIGQIALPFKKHWLTKENIGQLIESFKQAYAKPGCAGKLSRISYEIRKTSLIIKVEELTP